MLFIDWAACFRALVAKGSITDVRCGFCCQASSNFAPSLLLQLCWQPLPPQKTLGIALFFGILRHVASNPQLTGRGFRGGLRPSAPAPPPPSAPKNAADVPSKRPGGLGGPGVILGGSVDSKKGGKEVYPPQGGVGMHRPRRLDMQARDKTLRGRPNENQLVMPCGDVSPFGPHRVMHCMGPLQGYQYQPTPVLDMGKSAKRC